MDNNENANIGTVERALRMAVTLGIVVAVLNVNGELGYLALLPLLAIYTGITAFIGWDPIEALADSMKQSMTSSASRIDVGLAH